MKGGDLAQHYVAGKLWGEGEQAKLYSGYHLGDAINQWVLTLRPDSEPSIKQFNYVYSPFIAWCAAKLTFTSYSTWIYGWLFLMLFSYVAGAIFLIKSLPSLQLQPISTIFLLLGFPSFYYGLVPFQNAALTFMIIAASGFLLTKNQNYLAGLVMSCAFYKPQIMPYLALFIFISGNLKFCITLFSGNLAFLGIGILICGWDIHLQWFQSLANMAGGGQFEQVGLNQSLFGFLKSLQLSSEPVRFLLIEFLIEISFHQLFAMSLHLVGLTCIVLFAWKLRAETAGASRAYPLYMGMLAWVLFSPYVARYDLLVLVPLWLLFSMRSSDGNLKEISLLLTFWFISLLSVTGGVKDLSLFGIPLTGLSITSLLLLIWMFVAMRKTSFYAK